MESGHTGTFAALMKRNVVKVMRWLMVSHSFEYLENPKEVHPRHEDGVRWPEEGQGTGMT